MSQVVARGPHWDGWPLCPCGCGAQGMKLQLKHAQHLVGCVCHSCTGRRNRKKGQAAEARAHRSLGGLGPTIRDDLYYSYSLNVTVETKTGEQIPAKFASFIRSETVRHWMRQAEKKTPIGADALPALYLELAPSESYLVVKVGSRTLR